MSGTNTEDTSQSKVNTPYFMVKQTDHKQVVGSGDNVVCTKGYERRHGVVHVRGSLFTKGGENYVVVTQRTHSAKEYNRCIDCGGDTLRPIHGREEFTLNGTRYAKWSVHCIECHDVIALLEIVPHE